MDKERDKSEHRIFMFEFEGHKIFNYRGFKFIQHQDYNRITNRKGVTVRFKAIKISEEPPFLYAFWGGSVLTENKIMEYIDLNWSMLKHVKADAYKFKPLHSGNHWGIIDAG